MDFLLSEEEIKAIVEEAYAIEEIRTAALCLLFMKSGVQGQEKSAGWVAEM